MKFCVEPEVFRSLEGICFGVVAVSGIDNTIENQAVSQLLQESIAQCEAHFENRKVKDSPEIAGYREAFRKMGINPNKYMCSIEALLTRIAKKKGMPHINAIVDLGNAVSLKYKVPLGAHDLETISDSLWVRFTKPGDQFIPFGETESEAIDDGEIVYASDSCVRTRRWIWRQSEAGKITEQTSSVLFPIDGFENENKAQLLLARDQLAALLREIYPHCKVSVGWVDKDNTEFSIAL